MNTIFLIVIIVLVLTAVVYLICRFLYDDFDRELSELRFDKYLTRAESESLENDVDDEQSWEQEGEYCTLMDALKDAFTAHVIEPLSVFRLRVTHCISAIYKALSHLMKGG